MAARTLEVSEVSVRFGGVLALDGVSITVAPNEIVGIIGPNGAGKTTVFNAVSRLVAIQSGAITYGGQSLLERRSSQLAGIGIARTLQGLGYWPRLTVLENVMTGAPPRTTFVSDMLASPRAESRDAELAGQAMALLSELGVADRAHAHPGSLPYGVQKRVIIARALMAHPSLLLLDEPASGLSAGEVDELIALLRRLRGEMAIALVEHHVDMVMTVSDRVTVLNVGRVLASGAPDAVRADPAVATAYLGEQVARA